MQKLIMVIYYNFTPNHIKSYPNTFNSAWHNQDLMPGNENLNLSWRKPTRARIIAIKQPEKKKNLNVLLANNRILDSIKSFFSKYKSNIKHTYDHKIFYSIIEKQLYGKNSVDSLTHDLDKLILYILGFPHDFVAKFHRKISSHHTQSGKNINITSMVCDTIASSPDFKPNRKLTTRDYFTSNNKLQTIKGLAELLEKYNYGENLNIEQIKNKKQKFNGLKGLYKLSKKALKLLFR